jgi:hypothetical protein
MLGNHRACAGRDWLNMPPSWTRLRGAKQAIGSALVVRRSKNRSFAHA